MNKRKILSILYMTVFFVAAYAVITCAWVGAKYLFDGVVQTSRVDSFFSTAVAYYLTRDVFRLDRKYGRKPK